MTPEVVAALVDEGAALDARIKAEKKHFDEIKQRLIYYAQEYYSPEETTVPLIGATGRIAKVIRPDPTIKPKDEQIEAAREMIADEPTFKKLFERVVTWKPAKSFRDVAAALLGKKAAKVIATCEVESSPYVIFS